MDQKEVFTNLHYLPIIIFVSLPTTFLITYIIAVSLDHVEAGFPYISDTATYPPESCIFGQLLNMTAALMCFLSYLRYCQIKEYAELYKLSDSLRKWNFWGLIFGIVSSLGMSIVANFQETSVFTVHIVGATLCFGGATVYFWTQAMCSYYLQSLVCSLRLVYFRIFMSALCTIFFFSGMITASISQKAYKGTDAKKWHKEDGGWEWHIASTISEWMTAIFMCAYILSFAKEFKECQLHYPKVVLLTGKSKSSNNVLNESQNSEVIHQPTPTFA